MKKIFPLSDPVHQPARVIESIKSNIRKYLKRERRKPLPEGVDFWDFDCRFGDSAETATEIHIAEVTKQVDSAAAKAWESIYVEILAKPGYRTSKTAKPSGEDDQSEPE